MEKAPVRSFAERIKPQLRTVVPGLRRLAVPVRRSVGPQRHRNINACSSLLQRLPLLGGGPASGASNSVKAAAMYVSVFCGEQSAGVDFRKGGVRSGMRACGKAPGGEKGARLRRERCCGVAYLRGSGGGVTKGSAEGCGHGRAGRGRAQCVRCIIESVTRRPRSLKVSARLQRREGLCAPALQQPPRRLLLPARDGPTGCPLSEVSLGAHGHVSRQ